jgi:hypothetical protein
MAASDAKPIPVKAQAFRLTFPIFDADGDLVSGAAALDSEISKDGGTFTNCENEAIEIATSSGVYYLDLKAVEMDADTVAVIVKTSTAGAKAQTLVLYPASAAGVTLQVGSVQKTVTINNQDGDPVPGAEVWLSTDAAGANIVAGPRTTNDAGQVAFLIDLGVTYYAWCDSAEAEFTNPTEWTW